MNGASGRWIEVTSSQFAHETDGLALVRALLPDESPYRAWSNFEFRDTNGRWHEVDLLVLARDGFHLVELKYYSGRIRGNDLIWLRDGHRAEDSPLKLARRKAQYLASKLRDEYDRWVHDTRVVGEQPAREVVPFVQESVFLHHPGVKFEFPPGGDKDLYGLDGLERNTGLTGISELLLRPTGRGTPITPNREAVLTTLLARIGLVQRREREAGSWILDGDAIADGDGWQDWLATHRITPQERRRIRFRVLPEGASTTEQRKARQLAEHEFRVTRRLVHDTIQRPDDLVECELGVGLVYPYDPAWQRLDLWLAECPHGIGLDTALSIVRQVGDALSYAHMNRLVHRGLSPRAVLIRERAGGVRVQVGDWQSVGAIGAEGLSALPGAGVTLLASSGSDTAAVNEDDRWLREGFAAPEGALRRDADRVRVDVFGLGALAFYLLTGFPPARTAAALRDRIREQAGLDVSVELPEVSGPVRAAIRAATRPLVSERTVDVSTFLAQLEASSGEPTQDVVDPLEAPPGTLLGGRFRLERRLGAGSTAVGLLVTDTSAEGSLERVLKVALDDAAARRLVDEADVLRKLDSPRLVKLVEGPLTVGGRLALLLSSAGRETLAAELRQRPRLSLDLLERWGTDLLEALAALDKAGIDHRDIKPANLGISEVRSARADRAKHLVLFDFSLTRAAASATQAGTPPYLDPFLTGDRDRYDSAAERYAAAVVLFEMATGHTPVYGDGLSDPAAISDEATINVADFDPVVGRDLVAFFTRALARNAKARHDTVAEMLREWQRCFPPASTTTPDNANQLADTAELTTKLGSAGLSARAISALEPFQVVTVADLLAVDPVRLSRLSGTAEATRVEIKNRASQWRKRFGGPKRRPGGTVVRFDASLPGPHAAADQLLDVARRGRGKARVFLVSHVLGLTGRVEAFATQAQLAASLPDPVTSGRVNQLLGDLQEDWAADSGTVKLLDDLGDQVEAKLADIGEVATVSELADHLLSKMVAIQGSDDAVEGRLAEGLLRLVVERRRALVRGAGELSAYAQRRREGRPLLIATDPTLLDVAEALGQAADSLVAAVNGPSGHEVIVPAPRATEALTAVLGRAALPDALRDPARLVRLAAATSTRAGASGVGELHDRDLPAARALALTLPAVTATQRLEPSEVRDRVHARFPSLPKLPERPRLDQVVQDSGLGLIFDEAVRAYRPVARAHDTTGLESRPATVLVRDLSPVSADGAIGQRLTDSLARRSFLALGVAATYLDKAGDVLDRRYHATVIDLTRTLIGAMKATAATGGLRWPVVLAADAEPASSRGGQGLRVLVERALPAVQIAVEEALAAGADGPVVLTDASLLTRYGALAMLARWTDLATPRKRALWLVVPQLHANHGPVVDGKSLPLASPSQFVSLPGEWLDSQRHASDTGDAREGSTA